MKNQWVRPGTGNHPFLRPPPSPYKSLRSVSIPSPSPLLDYDTASSLNTTSSVPYTSYPRPPLPHPLVAMANDSYFPPTPPHDDTDSAAQESKMPTELAPQRRCSAGQRTDGDKGCSQPHGSQALPLAQSAEDPARVPPGLPLWYVSIHLLYTPSLGAYDYMRLRDVQYVKLRCSHLCRSTPTTLLGLRTAATMSESLEWRLSVATTVLNCHPGTHLPTPRWVNVSPPFLGRRSTMLF